MKRLLLIVAVFLTFVPQVRAATVILPGMISGVFCKCNAPDGQPLADDTTVWWWANQMIYPVGLPVTLVTTATGYDLTFAGHTESFTPSQLLVEEYVNNAGLGATIKDLVANPLGILSIGAICDVVVPGVPEPSTWAMMLVGLALLWFTRAGSSLGSRWRAPAAARQKAALA